MEQPSRRSPARVALAALVALCLSACAGGSAGTAGASGAAIPQTRGAASRQHRATGSSNLITHVVIVVQENRSFDNLFATFPGADGATQGQTSNGQIVPLVESNLVAKCDLGHSRQGYVRDYDHGKMDGFNLEGGSGSCGGKANSLPYQYVYPNQIAPYWDIASQWVLGDHMFQTQGSGSFTSHQDLIAGATIYDPVKTKSLVDFPSASPWGCDAPSGTTTSYIVPVGSKLQYKFDKGPFPCMTYATLRDLLDAHGVSWTYYSPIVHQGQGGANWNAFDAIQAVREGSEWTTNISSPETKIFKDISSGTLASVSWVIPDKINSDHPGGSSDTGPSWVASIVNAVGESAYWPSTAVIIVWDDWGGFYDHEPPPFIDNLGGLGFRVPMMIVSPYARVGGSGSGYISHTPYEFGSILKFVEDVWGLGSLGTTDQRAASIVDSFDFTQQPRTFTAIPSQYSKAYFLHQRPSGQPVDDQ